MDIRFALVELPVAELLMERQRLGSAAASHGSAADPLDRTERWPRWERQAATLGYPWHGQPAAMPARRAALPGTAMLRGLVRLLRQARLQREQRGLKP